MAKLVWAETSTTAENRAKAMILLELFIRFLLGIAPAECRPAIYDSDRPADADGNKRPLDFQLVHASRWEPGKVGLKINATFYFR